MAAGYIYNSGDDNIKMPKFEDIEVSKGWHDIIKDSIIDNSPCSDCTEDIICESCCRGNISLNYTVEPGIGILDNRSVLKCEF